MEGFFSFAFALQINDTLGIVHLKEKIKLGNGIPHGKNRMQNFLSKIS